MELQQVRIVTNNIMALVLILLHTPQTLLKTEILKNQLQIATISQAQSPPTMSTTSSLLLGSLNLPQNENGLQQSDSVDDSPSFNFVPSPTASENAKSLGLAKYVNTLGPPFPKCCA